jgi:Asp-tRNA(Asn)/Glu-tRNA(Gln) amidotransferase A subunit family amidase
MARNADDAALLLEAMMGDDGGLTPISVTPSWKSLAATVAQSRDLKNVRIGYAPNIAGLGIDPEISTACRNAAMRLDDHGARIEEIEFLVADGLEAFLVLRGAPIVSFARLAARSAMNSQFLFAAGIIARCIAVAMKLRGGRKSVLIQLPWLAPFG